MIDQINKILPWVFGIIFLGNLIFLDLNLVSKNKNQELSVVTNNLEISPKPTVNLVSDNKCSADCLQTIQEEVNQAVSSLPSIALRKITPTPTTVSQASKVAYFPIASSGSTEKNTWTDIPGTDFYFNISDYPGAKNVQLEVSVQSSTSDAAYIRLYDVTNNRGVDNSEQSTSSSTYTLLRSGNLTIWNGNNLYRIQAKGLNGNISYFTSPRLKILY